MQNSTNIPPVLSAIPAAVGSAPAQHPSPPDAQILLLFMSPSWGKEAKQLLCSSKVLAAAAELQLAGEIPAHLQQLVRALGAASQPCHTSGSPYSH